MNAHRKKLLVASTAVVVLGGGLLWWRSQNSLPWENPSSSPAPPGGTPSERGARLEAREREADQTYWAKEILAERCGRTFEALWDALNASTNKLGLLADFSAGEVVLGDWGAPQHLPHGIEWRQANGLGPTLSQQDWRGRIAAFAGEGWQLDNIEFRHNRFDTDESGQPRQSHFYFAARLTNPAGPQRATISGDLIVDWAAQRTGEEFVPIKRIDASHLNVASRTGEPPFQLILNDRLVPPERSTYVDPLLLYDLDGDGLSEIILAEKNLVYRRTGPDRYQPAPLFRFPVERITSALIADFDGDGLADFLCANNKGLWLFKGSSQGTFDEPARLVWPADPPLINTMAITCGDIDHDGDLDVFLGQYKVPSLGQVLRPYYYDANDGYPSHLLLNDGHGNFTDATEASGLGPKRWRRVYSASFADLDADGHLDLVVVSDFAGIDVYRNDGHGRFHDVTRDWIPEPHGFGMAHALADFNVDGRLDLLMIGMPSPTVDRLEHLGLWRPYSDEDRSRRPAMTFGNRLLLARPNGGFEQNALSDSIARSGWSWGCAAFDFDNDGYPDIYIANGLESKQSVRDYEAEFWLHDIFIDEKVDDVAATAYLMNQFGRTRGAGWSYGGYEKNRFFLNQHGEWFIEIGHLAGVALEQDCRDIVADDLDGDGRVDLLVMTLEVWPEVKQTLRVYKNRLEDGGHWIGFRFREQPGKSPVGARVTIHYGGRSATRQIVTGDSHRSQYANTLHFGLGQADQVELVEIQWTNGQSFQMRQPRVDYYHSIK